MAVTNEQLQAIRDKFQKLVDDNGAADKAIADSNAAHAVLLVAQADVADKDAIKDKAEGQVAIDVGDLRVFIDGLTPY